MIVVHTSHLTSQTIFFLPAVGLFGHPTLAAHLILRHLAGMLLAYCKPSTKTAPSAPLARLMHTAFLDTIPAALQMELTSDVANIPEQCRHHDLKLENEDNTRTRYHSRTLSTVKTPSKVERVCIFIEYGKQSQRSECPCWIQFWQFENPSFSK